MVGGCSYLFLLVIAPFVRGQSGIAPNYSAEQCISWLAGLSAADVDGSGGLSEEEYHNFLSSIDEPPYVADYFAGYSGFNDLPWLFRLVHKSLACHCQQLGYGDQCCKGVDAEIVIVDPERTNSSSSVASERDAIRIDYSDLICQQLYFSLNRAIREPTGSPSAHQTESLSSSPTFSPSESPASAAPTPSPSASPRIPPVPTQTPTLSGAVSEINEPIEQPGEVPGHNEEGGLGTGAIVGIIFVTLFILILLIALVVYRRRRESKKLRKFAGNQLPDADLDEPWPGAEDGGMSRPEASPENMLPRAPEEDDESSAPSVWSDAEEGGSAASMMHEENKTSTKAVGSSLAAMGAASTVAKNLMSPPHGSHRV